MVETISWVFFGIALYWLGLMWLRRTGLLPAFVGTQGPIITVHTKRFRMFIDRLAAPKRLWRAWGNFGIGVAMVVLVGSFLFLVFAAVLTIRQPPPETAISRPQNVLVIPGVNEFLPLSVAPEIIAGLIVGLVVHEGGHAILCRVGDIEIESMGLALFAIIPIGAFVEPDDESRRSANRGDQTRMFAAGVMNNFLITILAFFVLFGPVMGSIGVASGAAIGGVLPGSAADDAGIDQGDRILSVDGRNVANNTEFESVLANTESREVAVTVTDGENRNNVTVNRSVLTVTATRGTPLGDSIGNGATIVTANGESVYTEAALLAALRSQPVGTIETADGSSVTVPIGSAVVVQENGPMAAAGVPGGSAGVITAINDERIVSSTELSDVLEQTRPGDTVTVEFWVDNERRVRDVPLGTHPQDDHGFLGVNVAPGVSGVSVSDFGTRLYPAEIYLGLLGGGTNGGGSFFGRILIALQLPLASLATDLPFNFAGFAGGIENFYVVAGPLAAFEQGMFVLANLLFWIGWINLNLGVFNCIPAFPLDGGHLLRTSTEAIVSRLPFEHRTWVIRSVTTSVGMVMLVSLLLMIFGPRLL